MFWNKELTILPRSGFPATAPSQCSIPFSAPFPRVEASSQPKAIKESSQWSKGL
jgi:hypothetical protein